MNVESIDSCDGNLLNKEPNAWDDEVWEFVREFMRIWSVFSGFLKFALGWSDIIIELNNEILHSSFGWKGLLSWNDEESMVKDLSRILI